MRNPGKRGAEGLAESERGLRGGRRKRKIETAHVCGGWRTECAD